MNGTWNWTDEDRRAIEELFAAFLPAERPLRRPPTAWSRRPVEIEIEMILHRLDPFSLRPEDLTAPGSARALAHADVETLAYLLPGICRAALAERRASLLLERLNHQLLRTLSARRLVALHEFLSHLEACGVAAREDPWARGRLRLMIEETRVMRSVAG